MKSEQIIIDGMNCDHCVTALKKELSKLPVEIKSIGIGFADLQYEDHYANREQIFKAVHAAGFRVKTGV